MSDSVADKESGTNNLVYRWETEWWMSLTCSHEE